ncbi:uncharacterized protein F5891DRAFT_1063747 [Suillus fuscotomentosus]|uniref:Uncharacterized protein n=1 Tax=Suillus fuscotomentosus TaxID=1912939 RepID=A0AAD4DWU3_9AGAM|nr:uncharacterized protein F5891DRAFT_1063747 [Suillus fuscotomentosus]KAG1894063.1 hypothetical protein F5891DRAFT_1063747 [Suillus fuscotomentosus]
MDEGSAGVAKDALHNYKLDGENKITGRLSLRFRLHHSPGSELFVFKLFALELIDAT